MKKIKHIGLLLFTVFISIVAKSQDEAKIRVIARPYKDSIKIRWAPNKPVAWFFLNEYGYRIERRTLMRDGVLLEEPDSVSPSNNIFKPEPLAKWEPYSEIDDYVAIAAQAIFGESFEVTHGITGSDIMTVINKSKELESKYSFALLAADFSAKVAELSGITFTDKNVKANEKYLYMIIPMVPVEKLQIDTGYVYVGTDDFKPLPRPIDVRGDFSEGSALISWNHTLFQNVYIAYKIERSDDNGKTFKAISDDPLITTTKESHKTPERMFIIDSLPQNDKEYFYRVRGITSFGEISEASDTISGLGYKRLPVSPSIKDIDVYNNKVATIEWSLPDSLNSYLSGFEIQRSVNDKGPFETVNKELIPAEQRKYADEPPYSYTYYKIVAKDKYNHSYQSYPYMVQIIDSIPPIKPEGLTGTIDTMGIVNLNWTLNKELDLLGYRVFISNFRNSEFAQITVSPVEDTVFVDTVNIKTLTQKVYYKIQAVDDHFNPSEFSEIFELRRPDKIPPVQAVFHSYETNENGIILGWYNSSSIDVAKHILYRKMEGETSWKVGAIFYPQDSIEMYTDTSTVEGKLYEYTIIAVDEMGLESKPIKPITVKQFQNKNKPAVQKLKYDVDRTEKYVELTWKYDQPEVKEFMIYKGNTVQDLSHYSTTNSFDFIDKKLKVNNIYYYVVKAVFKNGIESKMSGVLQVKY
jgi:fibronectin type 3 domain-containing protein